MSNTAVFGLSVLVYAGLPLVFVAWRTPFRFVLLYAHLAALLVFAGLLSGVYQLELAGLTIPAGQVAYAGLMFTAIVTLIAGRDLQVLRNVVAVTIAVDVLVLASFALTGYAVDAPNINDPFGVPEATFATVLRPVVTGGVLTVVLIVLLTSLLERAKARRSGRSMTMVYVLAFVGVLTIDGLLFPVVAQAPTPGLGAAVVEGVLGKLLLAGVYAVPLLGFVVFHRGLVERFEATPIPVRQLAALSRDPLLDRLDATERLAGRAQATVQRILDAATGTALVTLDPDFRITRFNRGAELLFGYTEAEVLGRTPEILRHADGVTPDGHVRGVPRDETTSTWRGLSDGVHRDAHYRDKSGAEVVLSLSVNEIRSDGVLIGYLATGEDVTERARAEQVQAEALRREQESVRRLEEADAVKDELVSTISHELRTPITSIQGYTELIVDGAYGPVDPRQSEALEKVDRNVTRLRALVDDLLYVARGPDAGPSGRATPLDLREVVTDAWSTVEQLAADRRLDLRLDLPREPVVVTGDPLVLERLVLNLAGNAVKFTPDGGRVTCSARTAATEAVLAVSDTGMGIPTEDLGRVFERFWRAPQAHDEQIAGSGLGLPVAQRIVAEHQGSIEVESALGEGTTVTVRLPSATLPA
ncbi:sensor histidine kinase [Nocardioides aequoreus]|uniref:sensor histidine kinase n=1 Tax=Nocardioides aequoreus TaxID=397278 RepID=UPI000690A056|nr:ATP-binding protein [Nocardioides aequoreus]